MKFRAAPIVHRAVYEGLVQGMQQAKGAGDTATPDQILAITSNAVMQKLSEVLIFDQDEENLLTLQRIAEDIAVKQTPPSNG